MKFEELTPDVPELAAPFADPILRNLDEAVRFTGRLADAVAPQRAHDHAGPCLTGVFQHARCPPLQIHWNHLTQIALGRSSAWHRSANSPEQDHRHETHHASDAVIALDAYRNGYWTDLGCGAFHC